LSFGACFLFFFLFALNPPFSCPGFFQSRARFRCPPHGFFPTAALGWPDFWRVLFFFLFLPRFSCPAPHLQDLLCLGCASCVAWPVSADMSFFVLFLHPSFPFFRYLLLPVRVPSGAAIRVGPMRTFYPQPQLPFPPRTDRRRSPPSQLTRHTTRGSLPHLPPRNHFKSQIPFPPPRSPLSSGRRLVRTTCCCFLLLRGAPFSFVFSPTLFSSCTFFAIRVPLPAFFAVFYHPPDHARDRVFKWTFPLVGPRQCGSPLPFSFRCSFSLLSFVSHFFLDDLCPPRTLRVCARLSFSAGEAPFSPGLSDGCAESFPSSSSRLVSALMLVFFPPALFDTFLPLFRYSLFQLAPPMDDFFSPTQDRLSFKASRFFSNFSSLPLQVRFAPLVSHSPHPSQVRGCFFCPPLQLPFLLPR